MVQSTNPSPNQARPRAPTADRDAFGVLVEEHQVAVYNLCYRMLGDPYLAEDAAQETFLRAYSGYQRFDPTRSVRTWLLSIAAHHCIDQLRRRALLTWLPLSEQPIPASGAGPEAALLQRETQDDVRRMLEQLQPEERAVIVLRYWYDLALEEVAEVVGSSVDAVRTRLYRARRRLASTEVVSPAAGGWRDEPQAL
jgi:RNA polymerase sigma-70 factor (ECF subfamily)